MKVARYRMTPENLHPDIVRIEALAERKTVGVIDPAPGIWNRHEPIEGLVAVVYECPDPEKFAQDPSGPMWKWCPNLEPGHTHQALYGPNCWTNPETGEFEVRPGAEGMELYAD